MSHSRKIEIAQESHARKIEIAQYFLSQAQVYLLAFHTWQAAAGTDQAAADTNHLFWALDNARTRLAMARNWFRIAGAL